METTVIERIAKVKKNESLTNQKLSNKSNIPIETIKSMFSKKTNPSLDTIQKIYSAFPHYSLEWIICGVGDMYKKETGEKLIEIFAGKKLSIDDLRREYLRLFHLEKHLNYLSDVGSTYSTNEIAAELDMTATDLNMQLAEKGIIHKESDKWLLCDEYLGYDYQKPCTYINDDITKDYMRWTVKGRYFIYSLFNNYSIAAEPTPEYGNTNAVDRELKNQNIQQQKDIEWYKKELDKKQEIIDILLSGSVTVQKNVS